MLKTPLLFKEETENWILNVHTAYLIIFFSWTRVLKHNKYVEIKKKSKIDIKQNNISTVILLIKFLVHQWDPRHLQGSRVVYIYVLHDERRVLSNI